MQENPEFEDSGENPIPLTLTQFERNVRLYMARPRQVLRGLERVARTDVTLREQIRELGGLGRVITTDFQEPEVGELAPRFLTMQSTMYLDHFFDGNAVDSPTAQTLAEELGEIKSKVTKIATHLDECCAAIKSKLDNLDRKVTSNQRVLLGQLKRECNLIRFVIRNNFRSVFRRLDALLASLNESLAEGFAALTDTVREEIGRVITRIGALELSIQNSLAELREGLQIYIATQLAPITEELLVVAAELTAIQTTLAVVEGTVATVLTTCLGGFATIESTLALQAFSLRSAISSSAKGVISVVDAKTSGIQAALSEFETRLNSKIEALDTKLSKQIVDAKAELKKHIDDELEKLPEKVALETSFYVVGESYIKWDSQTQYYPTLVFIFNEVTENNARRKTQIKLRFLKKTSEITQADISTLKRNAQGVKNLTYIYGTVRGNYVAPQKIWKTNIYGNSKETIINVLTRLCTVTGEALRPELFSFTEGNGRRPNLTRRETPLGDVGVNSVTYNETFRLSLRRAVLLLNGASRPISLLEQ